jgi:hypothetical protein
MGEAAPQAATASTGAWCRACKEPVKLLGSEVAPPELRPAVHAATRQEKGPGHGDEGWHIAIPTDENPVLRAEADRIEAELCRAFTLSARFGFLRADWSKDLVPLGVTARHYEAGTADEMRGRLRAVLGASVSGEIPETELLR